MPLSKPFLLALFALYPFAFGQQAARANAAADLSPGVVVEDIRHYWGAEQAGLQPEDILVEWSRGQAQGRIDSPFDFAEIELEQASRGAVTIRGLRGSQSRAWTLGPAAWGIKTRPNFRESQLILYRESQQLAENGNPAQAAERWRQGATSAKSEFGLNWLAPWLLLHAADMLSTAQKWSEADTMYKEALHKSEEVPNIGAHLLWNWAVSFTDRGDCSHAEQYYQHAANKWMGEELFLAKLLDGIGSAALACGDLSTAADYFKRALALQERLVPGGLDVARSLNNLGKIEKERGMLTDAEGYSRRALAIQEKVVPSSLDIADTLVTLGRAARDRGDLANAEHYSQRALAIQEELAPGNLAAAISLDVLGSIAQERGKLADAERCYREALVIQNKSGLDSLAATDSLRNLGTVSYMRGDLSSAENYFQRTLAIQKRLAPESSNIIFSLYYLGMLAHDRGDLASAEDYYRHVLTLEEKLMPNSLYVAATLNALGRVARDRRDPDSAEGYYRRTLVIQEKLAPGSLAVAVSLVCLGVVKHDRGEFTSAEGFYRRALAIDEKLAPDSLDTATSLYFLGVVARDRGNLASAEDYHRSALVIREKLAPGSLAMAASLDNLGRIKQDRGDLSNAEDYYQRALAIKGKHATGSTSHAITLSALAKLKDLQGQPQVAAQLYEQALTVLERQVTRLGGTEDARSVFRATYESYYKDYIDLLMTRKQPELAFHTLERARARALLEMLATARLDVRGAVDPALLNQERSLQDQLKGKINYRLRLLSDRHDEKQIEALDKEISGLLQQHDELKARIRANSPRYAALTQPQPLNSDTLQHLLPDNTLLLEYSLGENRSYVFAVTTSSIHAYELPSRVNIESKAERFYRLIAERSRIVPTENDRQRRTRLIGADADSRDAALELSRMVLGPVEAELQARRLLIVSDGALQYIPFAALPEPELQSGKSPSPLVLRHELISLPSASVLALLHQEPKRDTGQKEVAVFADPVFDSRDPRVKAAPIKQGALNQISSKSRSVTSTFLEPASRLNDNLTRSVADMDLNQNGAIHLPRLAFTRDEARAIMAVVTPGMGMEALGFNASRNLAVSGDLARYRVVHFATHALVDNIHPELSGLVLSLVDEKGEPMDGFLELQDIYNLDLSADLVVLSACQTALGKQINGEGMIGLTRGFMYAGAPRVLASLWKVDDFATAKLMAHFYKALEQDRMTPAQALRQAQVELLQERPWSAPYYWAGFTLQGDWR